MAELLENFGLTGTTRAEVRDDEEWKDAWKAYYKPLTFGEHQLLLRPSWIDRQPGDPELEVVLDPGRAFGTGLHQTTQLCLHRLCALARTDTSPTSVFDLGCGSGILSMAAARLFPSATRMLAVDIDPEATATTIENLQLASLHDRIDVQTGVLKDLTAEAYSILSFSERLGVFSRVAYTRLLGAAADSPIVDVEGDADQWFVGVGMFVRF